MSLLLFLFACRPEKSPVGDTGHTDTGDSYTLSEDICERVRAGAGGVDGVLGLSTAHADIRLFGTATDFNTADAGLIAALGGDDPVGAPDLEAYAAAVPDVCLLDAEGGTLGAATVESRDGLWWVTPGTGALEVPDDGAPAVLDLRGLPAVEGLDEALAAALAATAVGEVAMPGRRVRQWSGFVDQWNTSANVYTVERATLDSPSVTGVRTGGALYVVTEDRMAPAAVELAGAVALGGHGYLVGVDLQTGVAEMTWSPVGTRGFAWRSAIMDDDWPDTIHASVRTNSPDSVIAGLDPATLVASEWGDEARDGIGARNPFEEIPDATESVATFRAALVIAHGTLRRFYPYFEVVGDTIDDRLTEVLGDDIDPTDRWAHRARLGRLGNALSDGHMFTGVLDPTGLLAGYLPASYAQVDGLPVVAHSGVAGLDRGDAVIAVDGVRIEDLQADWLTWHGGATDGYRYDVANRELYYMHAAQTLTVRDPDGWEEELSVEPGTVDEFLALDFVWYTRANGTLDDIGYPNLAYLNLAYEVTTDLTEVDAVLATAATLDGLVIDMRGYPGVNHYSVLERLISGDYGSPFFRVPLWTGPDSFEVSQAQYNLSGDKDAYSGPIVLLVSPASVSAAENFCQMLIGAGRVDHVVGSESSAGTNGNISGMKLPGSYFFMFTGMEVLNPDGSQFHGIGIQADIVVEPSAADLRDGVDPVLEAAAAALTAD